MIRSVAIMVVMLASAVLARDLTLPDPALTPGAVTSITTEELCAKEYHTRDARSVSAADRKERFTAYGISCRPLFGKSKKLPRCSEWEIDHLASLELGGANARANLWAQPMKEARLKDKLENRLHKEVCAGNVTLQDAQDEIRTDWRIPYRHYFEPQEIDQ